jgi:hypothetical protein
VARRSGSSNAAPTPISRWRAPAHEAGRGL